MFASFFKSKVQRKNKVKKFVIMLLMEKQDEIDEETI